MQRRRRQPGGTQEQPQPRRVVLSMMDQPNPRAPGEAPPEQPEVLSTTDARGGTTGNKVRYVLIISVIVAVIAMVSVYAVSPKGTQDGATTAPGPR